VNQFIRIGMVFIVLVSVIAGCASPFPAPAPLNETPASVQPSSTPQFKASTLTPLPTLKPSPTLTPIPEFQINPAELRTVDIAFWYPWTAEMSTLLKQFIDEFNRLNLWGITVEGIPIGGTSQLFEQMLTAITEKKVPDILLAPTDQVATWYDMGVIMELDRYIQHPEWGIRQSEVGEYPVMYLQGSQVEGKQVGLPAFRSQTVLFYNQTWAKELGFPAPPRTPEEFKLQVCAAGKQNNTSPRVEYRGTGGWIADRDPQVILSWLLAFEANPLPASPRSAYQFNTPAGLTTFRFFRELLDQGCAWVSRVPSPYDYFSRRQVLIYSGTIQDFPAQVKAQQRANSQDEWVMLPYPAINRPLSLSATYSYTIPRSTPTRQLAAWLFLRFLSQPDRQTQLLMSGSTQAVHRIAQENINIYRQRFPMWSLVIRSDMTTFLTPNTPSWRIARRVLEDAAWQVFQTYTKSADLPGILAALDAQIADLTPKKP